MDKNKAKIAKVKLNDRDEKFIILVWNYDEGKYIAIQNKKKDYTDVTMFEEKYQAKAFAIGAGFEIEE